MVVAKPPVREISAEGIYFFVWLDFRWIGSKPCSVQVYPEDMRLIKSQLMWVAVLGFLCVGACVHRCVCACVCVSTSNTLNLNGAAEKNHHNFLWYTNKKVDVFQQGVICGR